MIAGATWLARPQAPAVVSTGSAAIGGPFRMTDQDGKPATEAALKGKWSAVFFGFTFCQTACPLTMHTLAVAQDRLGPKGKDLQVVFVSVDPERDTPALLKTYFSNNGFPKQVLGLTGTADQTAAIAKAYKIYYAKEGAGPDYVMDHTDATFLMNPEGRFAKVIPANLSPDQTAELIRDAMRGG